jgi:hypothetical protein
MGKSSRRWSGGNRKQLWQCCKDGKTKLLPLDFLQGYVDVDVDPQAPAPPAPSPQRAKHPVATLPAAAAEIEVRPPEDNHHRLHLCDGIVEGKPRPCIFSEDGRCIKPTYPFGCLRYRDKEEWGALPMEEEK